MPYDAAFYEQYRAYINEPQVRRNHDRMFRLFAQIMFPELPAVMDLGAHESVGEYAIKDKLHADYTGIDIHNTNGGITHGFRRMSFLRADYMDLDFTGRLSFEPNAFISLFSVEPSYSPAVRYGFYNRLFAKFSSVRWGLASGFFYESRRAAESVSETGDIVSYQTIEDPSLHLSPLFTELRVHLRTPSRMFGNDVIEAWKIFIRN
ncbi:MAG TPA: hypothetical protein VNG29_02670 [Candidatus Paceibacterota bacterium]|nr:hypothetical protein [Candidatus Paceibacterota bacterium]